MNDSLQINLAPLILITSEMFWKLTHNFCILQRPILNCFYLWNKNAQEISFQIKLFILYILPFYLT